MIDGGVNRDAGTTAPVEGLPEGEEGSETGNPAEVLSEDVRSPLAIRCWGTRGSIPAPGPATARYGGNTSCIEIRVGSRRILFDAGTGIRPLGSRLIEQGGELEATIFLTHFHWDHIQGFPFFTPLYDPASHLRIFGPRQGDLDVETLFAGQLGPIYFPVPYGALSGSLDFGHLNEGVWEDDGIHVRALRVRHPSYTVGYRLDTGGCSFCYIPDNELVGGEYEVEETGWPDRIREFVAGADVLIHDAMFTDEEYPAREGWGHSTFAQAVQLGRDAGVRRLLFFHHSPERSDADLDGIVERVRSTPEAQGSGMEIGAAAEGEEWIL